MGSIIKNNKPSIAIFFPVYNDESTVEKVAMKSLDVLSDIASDYKVIIVDDGSPDRSGEIADRLASQYPGKIISVHHEKNLGYGAALQTGFRYSLDYEWICFTDGDDQYDVRELYHISKLFHRYDLIVTFRYYKIYGTMRIFISYVYNKIIKWLFKSHLRDHNSGLKVIRSSVIKDMDIISTSPFVGAEIIIKSMVRGYHIGEVGIRTYPRTFGQSSSTSIRNIIASIRDMWRVYKEIFRQKS
jgi:glycosyltransferase involved in cell wall biosynthesis